MSSSAGQSFTGIIGAKMRYGWNMAMVIESYLVSRDALLNEVASEDGNKLSYKRL